MSMLPMRPGRMRDMITGTKSSQEEIDQWDQQNQGMQPMVQPQAPQQQAPQQQQALQQAIGGPGLDDVMGSVKLRGGQGQGVKPGKLGTAANIGGNALSGASMGSMIMPGVGTAIGAGLGAAYGGIKSLFGMRGGQQTDMSAGDYNNAVAAAYRTALGREQTPEEAAQNAFKGGKWVNEAQYKNNLGNIVNSPEAQAYAARQAAGPQAAPAAAPEAAAVAQAVAGPQGGGKGILEGFNADKLANAQHALKSPKYAFAAIAQKYDQSDPAQRQAMLAELKQNPFFKNATLTGNKGDILDVGEGADEAFKGIRQFDVIRAAGEGGKAWQWGERGGDSGGGAGGRGGFNPALYPNASGYDASGDPVLAAINGQSLNPVVAGMDRLRKLLGEIPGGINGIAGGGL